MDDDYIIIGRENNETVDTFFKLMKYEYYKHYWYIQLIVCLQISKRVFCNEPCITLNIVNLQMNDSGLYQCFALHEDTDTIQKMKVYELVPIGILHLLNYNSSGL